MEVTVPGLAMVRLRRVSLERRHGNLAEAETLLREAVDTAGTIAERSFYAVKLARLYLKVQKNLSKAKKVLLDAIESDQVSVVRSPARTVNRRTNSLNFFPPHFLFLYRQMQNFT